MFLGDKEIKGVVSFKIGNPNLAPLYSQEEIKCAIEREKIRQQKNVQE